jgi:iron complex transport system substrate-binding protein
MKKYENLNPKRIVSLTPSLTETLFALDLGHRVCGVTDSCDYPVKATDRPNVGCWFDPDLAKLSDLKPEMVLGLQSAHYQFKQKIESRGAPVLLVNPTTVDEAIADISRIGTILGAQVRSEKLVAELRARLSAVDARVKEIAASHKPTVCRILDMENGRFHVAGPLSFQYDIITRAGGLNVTNTTGEAYPNITLSRLQEWDPKVIFSCGFDLIKNPALTSRREWQALQAVKSDRVYSFDCGLTCRTGPRIVDMVELLFQTLYARAFV